MKPFFSPDNMAIDTKRIESGVGVAPPSNAAEPEALTARLAVYDAPAAAPRIFDVSATDPGDLIERLSATSFSLARDAGSSIPYTVLREIVENLVHADFREIVISILSDGQEIRFADQGPGIPDKKTALQPGYTTATGDMKRFIRGVGSGFPLVKEFLEHQGGSLDITDNLQAGTVVALRVAQTPALGDSAAAGNQKGTMPETGTEPVAPDPHLSDRQKKVLSLVLEYGEAGPTLVSRELGVALSTAHRDLAFLEHTDLITSSEAGKRVLTDQGARILDGLFS